MKLVSSAEMRAIEEEAIRRGVSLDALMEHAGFALAQVVQSSKPEGRIVILVGPGNNGGDGLVAARRLHTAGRDVVVSLFRDRKLMGYDGPVLQSETDTDLSALTVLLQEAAVVIDALLGIGQSRPVEGRLGDLVEACGEASNAMRIAADIPTGVSADTGEILGRAFRASTTLCMGFAKRGAVSYPGADYAGSVDVADIGFPPGIDTDLDARMPETNDIARLLPLRNQESNKGTFGRTLIVGGSDDFTGAPALSALGALRSGAGLAQVASIDQVVRAVSYHALEPIFAHLPELDGQIAPGAASAVRELLGHAGALVLGPGMGLSANTTALVRAMLDFLAEPDAPPAVLDADALNALSRLENWWGSVSRLVITPHPGEMSRLTGRPIQKIQANRLQTALDFAAQWKAVIVLKGARTIVADPSGRVSVNPTGGPNLATGGTGDVLSGIIGGLLAQGMSPFEAAEAGAYVHGQAGDIVAERLGDAGTLASDLLAEIPRARQHILREAGVTAS